MHWRVVVAVFCTLVATLTPTGASAEAPLDADDATGKQWRQLYETTGLSWNEVASVCPRDGVTPCSGSVGGKTLTGWVWGTDAQVQAFMGEYAPELLWTVPPMLSGEKYFYEGLSFLNVMRWTVYFSTTFSYSEWTGGWTASVDGNGAPIGGSAGFGWPPPAGHIGLAPLADPDEKNPYRGVWLFRTGVFDDTPPVVTPTLSGTAGTNGWYRSDVGVTWTVTDPESPIDELIGCDPASVEADTTGQAFSCQATSAGGTATGSTSVQRDATPPVVTCNQPAPTFDQGESFAKVSGTVTDATSGPVVVSMFAFVSTSTPGSFMATIPGTDRAGNTASTQCPYRVVVPTCKGLPPTILGTGQPDLLHGTAGADVIIALGGSDTVFGEGGADIICGGEGNDDLNGGAGKDYLDGGGGSDSIRGDGGKDTCTSGEIRMSSCDRII